MIVLLAFAVTLQLAVLVSGLAQRTVLSTAVLFLVSGFLVGSGWLGQGPEVNDRLLGAMAEVALFSVLFTDGMRTGGINEIRRSWRLPGRALLIGMPITIVGIAILAHFLVNLGWPAAFLVGAALSPTDPVFVSAIFAIEAVPARIKHVLNLESGLNDGLALPVVMLMLGLVGRNQETLGRIGADLVLGVAIGVAIPWLGIRLEESRFFQAVGIFQPLNAFALGLLVLSVSYATGMNLFLAAFAAGVSIATVSASVRKSFEQFGEFVTELFKLAALLLLGALIAPRFLVPLPSLEYVFVILATFAVRPVAIWISLLGTALDRREVLTVGWFGPKGFASVVYGLMILHAGLPHIAHIIALVVTASILVYSSTDILIGRWFESKHELERQRPKEQTT
jgi:NhaP-type Na+/H+ or K+/H+ antiporter